MMKFSVWSFSKRRSRRSPSQSEPQCVPQPVPQCVSQPAPQPVPQCAPQVVHQHQPVPRRECEKEASLLILPDGGVSIISQTWGRKVLVKDVLAQHPNHTLNCQTTRKVDLPLTYVLVPAHSYTLVPLERPSMATATVTGSQHSGRLGGAQSAPASVEGERFGDILASSWRYSEGPYAWTEANRNYQDHWRYRDSDPGGFSGTCACSYAQCSGTTGCHNAGTAADACPASGHRVPVKQQQLLSPRYPDITAEMDAPDLSHHHCHHLHTKTYHAGYCAGSDSHVRGSRQLAAPKPLHHDTPSCSQWQARGSGHCNHHESGSHVLTSPRGCYLTGSRYDSSPGSSNGHSNGDTITTCAAATARRNGRVVVACHSATGGSRCGHRHSASGDHDAISMVCGCGGGCHHAPTAATASHAVLTSPHPPSIVSPRGRRQATSTSQNHDDAVAYPSALRHHQPQQCVHPTHNCPSCHHQCQHQQQQHHHHHEQQQQQQQQQWVEDVNAAPSFHHDDSSLQFATAHNPPMYDLNASKATARRSLSWADGDAEMFRAVWMQVVEGGGVDGVAGANINPNGHAANNPLISPPVVSGTLPCSGASLATQTATATVLPEAPSLQSPTASSDWSGSYQCFPLPDTSASSLATATSLSAGNIRSSCSSLSSTVTVGPLAKTGSNASSVYSGTVAGGVCSQDDIAIGTGMGTLDEKPYVVRSRTVVEGDPGLEGSFPMTSNFSIWQRDIASCTPASSAADVKAIGNFLARRRRRSLDCVQKPQTAKGGIFFM